MLLLGKSYINGNTAKDFKLKEDLNVIYFNVISSMNTSYFKKVAIVKEFLSQLVDYIDVGKSDDIQNLEILKDQMQKN